jgi:hypothetical protein
MEFDVGSSTCKNLYDVCAFFAVLRGNLATLGSQPEDRCQEAREAPSECAGDQPGISTHFSLVHTCSNIVIEAGAAQYPNQLRIGNIRLDRRRTLELWRAVEMGCTEPIMLVQGFTSNK